jgi:hypothetical protein
MLTELTAATRRRTPGSGVVVEIADEHVALAVYTLGDDPRRAVFER